MHDLTALRDYYLRSHYLNSVLSSVITLITLLTSICLNFDILIGLKTRELTFAKLWSNLLSYGFEDLHFTGL